MMISTLVNIILIPLAILILFGLCIFVHELGHLLAALWRGLYVERFSIGFGKKLWGTTYKGVDYIVSMLPFGGYVALPQLEPSEEPVDEQGAPLPRARPFDRIITAFAGPLFNMLFGFLLAAIIWWVGTYEPQANSLEVYEVPESCPEYQAGLRPGDVIVKVNGEEFERGWEEAAYRIALSNGEVSLTVRRDGEKRVIEYPPEANPERDGLAYPFFKVQTPVVVTHAVADTPADEAGLQHGDRILSLNGTPPKNIQDLIERIQQSDGEPLAITIRRDGRDLQLPPITPEPVETENETLYRIGAQLDAPLELTHPTPWKQFTRVMDMTWGTLTAVTSSESHVKARHLSGPVGILQMLWLTLKYKGLRGALSFLILLNFNLAILNLLPFPVLDGGHILFAVTEMGIRRPIPARIAHTAQTAFAVLLISFMLYVTFWDVERLGKIIKMFSENDKPQQTEETGQ